MKIKLLTALIVILAVVSIVLINGDREKSELAFGAFPASIPFNGQTIDFTYTDENVGEDLLIYTDKATYSSWDSDYVHFAVQNVSGSSQTVKVQFLYNGGGEASVIEEYKPQVSYQETVNDYGTIEKACKVLKSTTLYGMPGYTCDNKETFCDRVVGKTCYNDNEFIGTHQETRQRDEWGVLTKKTVENLEASATKKAPAEFVAKEQFDYSIPNGQTKYFRAKLQFSPKSNGEFWIKAHGSLGAEGALDPWYSSSWSKRKSITIDHTKVPGSSNLTDFPVLVDLTDSNLSSTAQADGDDILFTSADGTTKLDHEIEIYASGRLVAWVQIPTLDFDDNTIIYMYYGNSGASSQQNPTGVWDSNYAFVLHVGDGSTLSGADSTSNNNDFTVTGSASAVAGKVDGAMNSNPNNPSEYLTITGNASLDSTDYTLETWMRINGNPDSASYDALFQFGNQFFFFKSEFDNKLHVDLPFVANDVVVGATALSDSTWYHVVATKSSTTYTVYLNGAQDGQNTNASTPGADANFYLSSFNGGIGTNGYRDEFRYSNIARSGDWIATGHNNMSATSTFYTIGAEETDNASVPTTQKFVLPTEYKGVSPSEVRVFIP